ncbi:hypothetical protein CONLIGDRAFT_481141 [Coniochaeta ligniaria NRRL 30616]|uniref:Uncharacterized protein n=1 Tax=Coniochaeta ligniaria NRRL 30616 TaxID=1408157 RepID=A0A1J7IH48_9PEZI|nr:hypothetical protein CONLIGDRAFT_481141 [Coniochaeta ligniaria NRRL 30616]
MALFWHDRASKELACVTGIESSFYSFRPITALVKNLPKLQHVALGKSFPDTHKCSLEIVGGWSLLLPSSPVRAPLALKRLRDFGGIQAWKLCFLRRTPLSGAALGRDRVHRLSSLGTDRKSFRPAQYLWTAPTHISRHPNQRTDSNGSFAVMLVGLRRPCACPTFVNPQRQRRRFAK